MRPRIVRSQEERLRLLVVELDDLRQRGIEGTFDRSQGKKPLNLDVLFDIAERRYPDDWQKDESGKVKAIKRLVRDAVEALPTVHISDPVEGSISWQEMALILYQLQLPNHRQFERVKREYSDAKQGHARLARYVWENFDFPPVGKDDYEIKSKQIRARMRGMMADALLNSESDNSENVDKDSEEIATDASTASSSRGKYGLSIGTVNGPFFYGDNNEIRQTFNYGDRSDEEW